MRAYVSPPSRLTGAYLSKSTMTWPWPVRDVTASSKWTSTTSAMMMVDVTSSLLHACKVFAAADLGYCTEGSMHAGCTLGAGILACAISRPRQIPRQHACCAQSRAEQSRAEQQLLLCTPVLHIVGMPQLALQLHSRLFHPRRLHLILHVACQGYHHPTRVEQGQQDARTLMEGMAVSPARSSSLTPRS